MAVNFKPGDLIRWEEYERDFWVLYDPETHSRSFESLSSDPLLVLGVTGDGYDLIVWLLDCVGRVAVDTWDGWGDEELREQFLSSAVRSAFKS